MSLTAAYIAHMRNPTDLQEQEAEAERQAHAGMVQAQQDKLDFQWVVSTEQGRRFLWDLLGFTGIYRSSFTGNSSTFFNEGRRDVGLRIMGQIHEHAPEAYLAMLKENT